MKNKRGMTNKKWVFAAKLSVTKQRKVSETRCLAIFFLRQKVGLKTFAYDSIN